MRMSLISESKRDSQGSGSASLSTCDQPKEGHVPQPLSKVMESVVSTICSLNALLCVTLWPAIRAPLLNEYPQGACQVVKQPLSSACRFLWEFGSSRRNVTLGGRKGTAGGHNRICRVSAFNPGRFSSPDGLRTTAFGIRGKKKKLELFHFNFLIIS